MRKCADFYSSSFWELTNVKLYPSLFIISANRRHPLCDDKTDTSIFGLSNLFINCLKSKLSKITNLTFLLSTFIINAFASLKMLDLNIYIINAKKCLIIDKFLNSLRNLKFQRILIVKIYENHKMEN